MARRKKGNPIHGWLVLDKPKDMTSNRALATVKRLFNAQKAGHAGTLDPLATGVLPIAFGEATKTAAYAVDDQKSYRFRVRWGEETDSADCDGTVVAQSAVRPDRAQIMTALTDFTGKIDQVPPAFSAIKINGERAYNLARNGEAVELAPRTVTVDELTLLDVCDGHSATFEVVCGKGTYIRSIARDLGRKLGCLGHVIELRRTGVGSFDEAQAVTLDQLANAENEAGAQTIMSHLQPIETALTGFAALRVAAEEVAQLRRGQAIIVRGAQVPDATRPVYAHAKGQVIALGEIEKGALRPFRVFNYGG